mmetsp:Transcript_2551/g.6137  ORF Transcript_2551/g.6137 Transcript_2551/m.6137 type:complete len:239 (+) Transcript_2551:1385-2101(+)
MIEQAPSDVAVDDQDSAGEPEIREVPQQQGLGQQLEGLQHLARESSGQRTQGPQSRAAASEVARLCIIAMLQQEGQVDQGLLQIVALPEPGICERLQQHSDVWQVHRVQPPIQSPQIGRQEVLVNPVRPGECAKDVAEVGLVHPWGDLLGPPTELLPDLGVNDFLLDALVSKNRQRHGIHLLDVKAATTQAVLRHVREAEEGGGRDRSLSPPLLLGLFPREVKAVEHRAWRADAVVLL